MKKNKKKKRIIVVLFFVLLLFLIASLFLGRLKIEPIQLFDFLKSQLTDADVQWTKQQQSIFFNVRIPRVIMAVMVGACLSIAGATYQGVFQNPMAAPDILGASAGAAFGASLAIVNEWSKEVIMLFAFFFGLGTVFIVYMVSKLAKGSQILGLVLSGIMISSLFSAGTSFIKLVADTQTQLPAITYWLMGSLNGVEKKDILFAAMPMLCGMLPLLVISWLINIMTLGDEEAETIGVNVRMIRLVSIICATLVTAASVAVSGMIGWVGLVIPHLSRRLVGNDYRFLLPASILSGGIFLLLVDNVSRNLLNTELPLGILNAVIGAPFFIYLLTRGEGVS